MLCRESGDPDATRGQRGKEEAGDKIEREKYDRDAIQRREMSVEPPPFQEAARCDVCKCSFNTFRRRHHCRCCGRTLCHEHSSDQMALPQFGLHTSVRVCSDCFNDSSRLGKVDPVASVDGVNSVVDSVAILNINPDVDLKTDVPTAMHHPVSSISDCNCGMPLCICQAPAEPVEAVPLQNKTITTSTTHLNPKPKKTDCNMKNRGSTSNSKHGLVSNLGQVSTSSLDKPQMDYDVNGEGLREAIKNSDAAAVKKLLSQGVDANYCDKQGLSVLHLAALFNQTEIAFILMESGASLEHKNAQGETPLDCAPATLQYKMRQKMEEGGKKG